MKNDIEALMQPIQIGDLILKNRVVMAPMTRNRADNAELIANDLMATYYQQRAEAGLIISEGTFVSPRARGYIRVPGIYSKKQIMGWQKVTQAVHKEGGRIFAQLWHVGRISHPDFHQGALPLAPSAINPHFKSYTPLGYQDTVCPKSMSIKEIEETINDFKIAAKHAMEAGFDGVELHAANGYLFHQFFATCANQRNDQYGGSEENRARFLLETLLEISKIMDLKKVGVRLNPGLDNSFGITKNEATTSTFHYIIQELNQFPLAYLHITGFSKMDFFDNNDFLKEAKYYRSIYNGVLMLNKGFDAFSAAEVIREGVADLVSFGEPFIANPDFVKRIANNWPLAEGDRKTYYTAGPKGYTDYPTYEEISISKKE